MTKRQDLDENEFDTDSQTSYNSSDKNYERETDGELQQPVSRYFLDDDLSNDQRQRVILLRDQDFEIARKNIEALYVTFNKQYGKKFNDMRVSEKEQLRLSQAVHELSDVCDAIKAAHLNYVNNGNFKQFKENCKTALTDEKLRAALRDEQSITRFLDQFAALIDSISATCMNGIFGQNEARDKRMVQSFFRACVKTRSEQVIDSIDKAVERIIDENTDPNNNNNNNNNNNK